MIVSYSGLSLSELRGSECDGCRCDTYTPVRSPSGTTMAASEPETASAFPSTRVPVTDAGDFNC